ncbi:MAG TPA: PBP1A family penicillin-binding protein [Terriglobia bacterium]|nr:PBP1A family penicillin-binding protein [Terriglobia bacterium]
MAAGLLTMLVGLGIFTYYYVRFARIIDARLSGDVFANASLVYAAPAEIRVGQPATPATIAARLRKAFYAEGEAGSNVGTYKLSGNRLEIYPGPTSFFHGDQIQEGPAALVFKGGQIASITTINRPASLENYWLEPEVLTTVFDRGRSKRLLLRYQDIPKVLVDAVLAAEDHRFFSHYGVSIYRVLGAAAADLRGDHGLQGGSTLTMQLAREFFLNRDRTWSVKVKQACLALMLEQRLSKEQIFEMYANQIYLGQRGSFSVEGFGEAASAYFNKDVGSLTLPEAALLAGLIRGPNLYSPYRNPQRAIERRNYVLRRMVETEAISASEAERAIAAPLGLAQRNVEGSQAPFFVDMVRDQLLERFSEQDLLSQSYRIYTSLDMDLQEAASNGARSGIAEVDQELKKRRRKNAHPGDPNQPQLAMVVLDPHTGVVKALVGGRNYGVSQLNHALARRQPGSSFKPFVYAAALSSGVDGSQPLITPATILKDEPTTFDFADQPYEPGNYMQEYHGEVTLRQALMLSLNNATVSLAEMVGYAKVRDLAVAAGINKDIGSTPALALGAYVTTPVEIAGAYTIFSNGGKYVAPRCILAVNDSAGHTLWSNPPVTRQVLDPRVSYLMVNLMESVINNGTGYPARARGFRLPAAGKTGTLHDGWFAGFTSNLLAVVWVGYDDDRQLNLTGASSALPIWTDFMKSATELPAYRDVHDFVAPSGIVTATVDTDSNLIANVNSASTHSEIFIEGTEPSVAGGAGMAPGIIDIKGGQPSGISRILGEILHGGQTHAQPAPLVQPTAAGTTPAAPADGSSTDPVAKPKSKGVLGRFLSVFKGKSQTPPPQTPPPKKPDSQ